MSDFYIVVALYAKQGRENELRADLVELVGPSRRDAGSLRYELLVQQDDPRRFVFVEHWASPEAQRQHDAETDHIRRFKEHGFDAVEKVEFFYRLNLVE